MGASILPVTIHNNKIYFLFGKERDIDENPGWSDFGGGSEKGESFLTTAIREGSEEITGFLGNTKDIRKLLSKYGTYNIDFKTDGHSTYRVHIFPMVYDNMLVEYYNNNQTFLQQKLEPNIIRDSKIFEKAEIKWFSFDEITQNKKKFRSFYQKILLLILQNKKQIQNFIKTKLSKSKSNTKKHKYKYKTIKNKIKPKTRKNIK